MTLAFNFNFCYNNVPYLRTIQNQFPSNITFYLHYNPAMPNKRFEAFNFMMKIYHIVMLATRIQPNYGSNGYLANQSFPQSWSIIYVEVCGNTVHYSTIQCSTVQWSLQHCGAVHYNTVQCSLVFCVLMQYIVDMTILTPRWPGLEVSHSPSRHLWE